MKHARPTLSLIAFVVLTMLALSACSSSAPAATPETIVQIETVEVEVTRLVEVERTVEVTREVIQTQVVEKVITATPEPAPTATPTLAYVPTTIAVTPWSEITLPQDGEKIQGISYLKVTNRSGVRLDLTITGPVYAEASISDNDDWRKNIPEGEYFYTVSLEGTALYSGTIRLTNPDKHELILMESSANFLVP